MLLLADRKVAISGFKEILRRPVFRSGLHW